VYLSPIWKQMLGYHDSEIANTLEEWKSRVHPDDRDRVFFMLREYVAGRLPEYEIEHRVCHKDNSYRWILSRGTCLRDATGQATRMAGSHVDLTGHHALRESLARTRQALHQQTTLLVKLSESIDQVFWFMELDPERGSYVNPAFEQIWGLPAKEFYREPRIWLRSIHEEDRKRTADAFDAFVSGQAKTYGGEYRIRRPDGTIRWIQDHGARMTDHAGQVRWVRGIATDVTESKSAEEALRESEGRFQHMADAAPMPMWMSGADSGCIYFNKSWLNFTGRSIEQELGDGWAENVHPDDVGMCLEVYSRAFNERKDFTTEYRLRRADGEYRWMWDIGAPRVGAYGHFAGYIGSCVDITDRKRAELAIHDMGRRLLSAQEVERSAIARELHDDIGQRLALLSVKLDRVAARAQRWAKQDRTLIEELRQQTNGITADVQHISHQLHPAKLGLLGLSATMRSFCREVQASGKLHIRFVTRDVPATLPKKTALCLYRVFQEAIGNILKHSGASTARVILCGGSSSITLRIFDRGAGFDSDLCREKEGLGLISMRERVGLLEGEIQIDSKLYRGTCVSVTLPLAPSVPGSIE
ncbi:MAG: PAS domain-containing protein, partial [Nitrospirota bacterium]|nr:PAS domain-containing protein [Nitrospirota bacterium]